MVLLDRYQINEELMARITRPGDEWPLFMHCLPCAPRPGGPTDEAIDCALDRLRRGREPDVGAENVLLWHMLARG